MTTTYRLVKAVQLFAVAGAVVSCALIATAAVGVIAGGAGSSMPGSFVVAFWLLCAVFGAPFAWLFSGKISVGWPR